jgi:hypothetical protein
VAIDKVGLHLWPSTANTMTALTWPGSRPVIFVEDPRISAQAAMPPFAVTMMRPALANGEHPTAVPARVLDVLSRGAGWALVQLPPQPRFVAFTIGVLFN